MGILLENRHSVHDDVHDDAHGGAHGGANEGVDDGDGDNEVVWVVFAMVLAKVVM